MTGGVILGSGKLDVWDLYSVKCYSGERLIFDEKAWHLRNSWGQTYYADNGRSPENAACIYSLIEKDVPSPRSK